MANKERKLRDFTSVQRDETTGKRIFDLNDENNIYDNSEKIHMRFINKIEVE